MNLIKHIAQHFRAVYFGGNWTSVNLKDSLSDVSWQQATTQVYSLHTIAALVYHTNYYVGAILRVLQGGSLDAKDQYSFDLPLIQSAEDWNKLLAKSWSEAEQCASLIEQLPEQRLEECFVDEKYGNHYRNLQGVIEHTHYHLGQIILLKKLLAQSSNSAT
ncbi:DinB family protein [Hymenobacter sp. 5516J-16]|uniref:DinB family protein n=1 Tax=Hymenobacter sp. 5516J-16 TaxID=2932253 RepID=UPI001FD3C606|nr:DinB family protein [Hymenobacter sp. 5516J-16]UOQ75801.1 DinB family protein [Hymenobacter sp. 5516J-16]